MRIDAHHHFWKYNPAEYGWIPDHMAFLRRDFLAADLAPLLGAAGFDGAVTVQVRQNVEENRFLLDIAAKAPIIRGVVGWAPLADPGVDTVLEEFSANRTFKGVRHILQDEPANQLMDDDAFNRGVARLSRFGLVYDLLIYERHLDQAIAFVDRHPATVFVLNHVAKPRIKDGITEPWSARIRDLALRPNVYCKISGMATEGDWAAWTAADLTPYLDTVLEAFTPRRLMFGSDWPVALVATPYQRWVDTVAAALSRLSSDEQARIWSGTAGEAYRL